MGDFHFVVRHGLTGGVLLLFVVLGVLVSDPQAIMDTLNFLKSNQNANAFITILIAVLFTTPVIGIIIQSFYVTFLYVSGRAFNDPARQLLADRVYQAVSSSSVKDEDKRKCLDALEQMPDDSPFVFLYYAHAPAHLVDWARRRRSYHYLGVNWAIAALVGVVLGWFEPHIASAVAHSGAPALILLLLVWVLGTCWLALMMKHDVDSMELVWVYSRLYPDAFKELLADQKK